MAKFVPPVIQDNPGGWGPCQLPTQYKDMPYQPFSKGDRLGRIADWFATPYQDRRAQYKYNSAFGNGQQYSYVHDEDDKSFHYRDHREKLTISNYQRQLARTQMERLQKSRRNALNVTKQGQLTKTQKVRAREVKRQEKKWMKTVGKNLQARRRQMLQDQHKTREASVPVHDSWSVLEEMDYARLLKLKLPTVKDGEDLYIAGSLQFYDKAHDRINTRSAKKLVRINKTVHSVSTTDDPVIRRLTRQGNVFATDAILTTLMCCTRSVCPWDIVVQKVKDKIFLDKRDDSNLDMLSVSETALIPPDDDSPINSARNLSMEATYINHNFSQQVLKDDRHNFEKPNPFVTEDDNPDSIASIAYKYRRFDIGNDLQVVVRCHFDAAMAATGGEVQFVNVKTLNEWDSSKSGGVDWRSKIDVQRGTVIATEIKNNSFKMAKWTASALLAGSDQIKFGFVSRKSPRDSRNHELLGVQQFKPNEFALQMNLNMDNAWGILRCMLDIIKKLDDGKYLIMKDPNKQMVRIYDIPNHSFESDCEESDEETESEDGDAEDDDNDDADAEGDIIDNLDSEESADDTDEDE